PHSAPEPEKVISHDAGEENLERDVALEEPVVAPELSVTDDLLSASDDEWMNLADVLRRAGLGERRVGTLLQGAFFSEWRERLIVRQLEARQGAFGKSFSSLRIEELQTMFRERAEVE